MSDIGEQQPASGQQPYPFAPPAPGNYGPPPAVYYGPPEPSVVGAEPGTPYHLLARTSKHRWWRPLVGLLLLVVAGLFAGLVVTLLGTALAWALGVPITDSLEPESPTWKLGIGLAGLAVLTPVVLFVAWLVQRRPAGTVSSVLGRLRWRWLGTAFLTALVIWLLQLGVSFALDPTLDTDKWPGWSTFLTATVVTLVLVPLQATAEEYVFRGWLLQAFASWFRTPWPGIVLLSVGFAAGHEYSDPLIWVDLVSMSLTMCWLTIRTGGLEAAIAFHTVNNLFAFGLSNINNEGVGDQTVTKIGYPELAVSLLCYLVFALVITRLAERRKLDRVVPVPAGDHTRE
ncbi:CPBP family intramembrane metalloprotease [Pseudonocardiaceae bacterium YIM PH 21723]|nr:CPBP family intramembrane metalloprotease [Pseudonocardiaceae bacterium YIM PH 21723]